MNVQPHKGKRKSASLDADTAASSTRSGLPGVKRVKCEDLGNPLLDTVYDATAHALQLTKLVKFKSEQVKNLISEIGQSEFDSRQSRARYCDLLAAFSKSQLVGLLADACVMFPSDVGKAVDCFDQARSVTSEGSRCGGKACGNPLCGFEGETLDGKWWDTRFREDEINEKTSEWLLSFTGFGHFFTPHLSKQGRTLVIGCGNCNFSACLYEEGYTNIINTDISEVVINRMQQTHKVSCPGMQWLVDDCTKMKFATDSFDQIVDKSLLDCMCYCFEPHFEDCITKMVKECFRVLRPGGVALFGTKKHISVFEDQVGGAKLVEAGRWCDLDWHVSTQMIFAPKDGCDGELSKHTMAVANREDIPQRPDGKGFVDYCAFYIHKCIKRSVVEPSGRACEGAEVLNMNIE